jgi:hypothetical protein
MHPMKLITYTMLIGVASLMALGGIGFYVGYSVGRGDLDEMKTFVLKSMSPENAAALNEALKAQSGKSTGATSEASLAPLMEEIRNMSAQIGRLEQSQTTGGGPKVIEKIKEDPKLKEDLAALMTKLNQATEQYNTCTRDLSMVKAKLEVQASNAGQQQRTALTQPQARSGAERDAASVVLYDNVLLKRDQNKVYNDVDVSLSLQSVASRSARVVVNQQALQIAFGERKIIQHRDVTCELQLMETDLDVTQARVNIACKR